MPDSVDSHSDARALSLAQRGLRGAAWNYGGAAIVITGQLAYTALTARLISPREFGAYATAQALLMLVGYFTLGSVGNALIRHPALDRDAIGTGLILTGIAGVVVAVFVLVAATPWADLWRSPGAAPLIRLYAAQVLLIALATVPMSLLRRNLRYRSASLIETVSTLAGFGLGAGLAFELRGAEALVLGQVASAAVLIGMSALATRAQLGVSFSSSEVRSLFSFSAQVSAQSMGHYVNNVLPSFVVSRTLGQANLGFFNRASLLVGLPLTFLAQGANKTLYPLYPRFRENLDECRRVLGDVASVATTIVWPLFAALAGLAPLVVELLLGPRWTPVASLVGPLCLYATMNFIYSLLTTYAESLGYLRQIWVVQICWTATLACALAIAVSADASMRGIVLVATSVQFVIHLLQIGLLARQRSVDIAGIVRAELAAGLLAGFWYVTTVLTTDVVSNLAVATQAVAGGAAITLLTLVTWLALPYLPAGRAFERRGIRIPTLASAVRAIG